ncbi:capsular polysaccharide biosynthesis protein Cap8F [Geothrix oryzae]|uniref:Capsular polysaccharide biosynthesis protein Cap8F n=1 Tax=Geothrix oryzae TaxID=2927975 RepID=A0ABM8DTU8_9BACT|nr:capsular polysaccharide biosynthesis protein CapF [Geothrix oryzae]BDU70448.1 capsular polysaccharide biosynthesis protein Cap8F [Geothrix oryzae]
MKKTVLVTGANGFVGSNLCAALKYRKDVNLLTYDVNDPLDALPERVLAASAIVHLAGINRPEHPKEFLAGNVNLTTQLVQILQTAGKSTPLILSSSTQAALANPYGESKLAAEEAVFEYSRATGTSVFVYRLPNLFGKWCRPNYNSVVATFCHNIAHKLPIQINNPDAPLDLVYIDDLIDAFCQALEGRAVMNGPFCTVPVVYKTTVGNLADRIRAFASSRDDLSIPPMDDPFTRKLYSTYLSALPTDQFSYPIKMHRDSRGSFTEFLKTPDRGQVSVNISHPGITKGNHWHHTKNEKFLVVSGTGVIRFRKLGTQEVIEYRVSGEKLEVVDIPPGYTHNITNIGECDMVTIMWVNEPFDRDRPDTWIEEV